MLKHHQNVCLLIQCNCPMSEASFKPFFHDIILQVAELASLAQLLPPCSPTWVIRRRTAALSELRTAPQLRPLQLLLADCIDPLQLLFRVFVRFSCCSPLVSTSAATPRLGQLLPDSVRFDCCSSIASASTAALASPAAHRYCIHQLF